MIILGINCFGHDSAASFLIDGEIKFACEEERLNRIKHTGQIPLESIREGLEALNIKWSDIDHVTYSWKPSLTYKSMPKYALRYFYRIPTLLKEKKNFSMEENLGMLNYLKDIKRIPKTLDSKFGNGRYQFHKLEHHLTHAASAFYPSGFSDAAIITVDGAGEWATMTIQHGNGLKIQKLKSVNTPHSLGAVYQAVSVHLGFKRIEGPGKLMGLASYGNRDSKAYEKFKDVIRLTSDGGFKVDMSYFSYHYSRKKPVTQKFEKHFGPQTNLVGSWNKSELELAAAVQRRVEDVFLHMAKHAKQLTKSENLVLAGGVALNSVANGVIAKSAIFKNIFIQPAAGDSGTSAGGALHVYHELLGAPSPRPWGHAFLGPKYSNERIETSLKEQSLNFEFLSDDEIVDKVSDLLVDGKIVAWFQGNMEFGPRALGNRSFLASPLISEMKEILNQRVKFREDFRPFAAAILEEDQDRYLDFSIKNPYMLMVFNVKKDMRRVIPAITHVDGTVRIQTVTELENYKLHKLLQVFKEKTGHGVILNTSFNIKGEPIVCIPEDAISSFMRADVDALAIGNYLVVK
jgi:carbamoyltransferase